MKKPKTDYCLITLIMSSIMFIFTWFVAIMSWITTGEMPEQLVQHVLLLHGVCYAAYCCKSAYENRKDVKNDHIKDAQP